MIKYENKLILMPLQKCTGKFLDTAPQMRYCDDDFVQFFCYHKYARSQLFTCYPVSSGKTPVIELM